MKRIIVLFTCVFLFLTSSVLSFSAVSGQTTAEGAIIENPLYVWLIAGQSNAAGYTSGTSYSGNRRYTDVLYYGIADDQSLSSAEVTDVHIGLGADSSKIGPEMGMAASVTGNEEGRDYAIIKCAYGGTPFSPSAISADTSAQSYRYGSWTSPGYLADHPTSNSRAGLCYENLLKVVESGLNAYRSLGYTPIVSGVAWMQGEADAWSNISSEVYKELLLDFVSDLQQDVKEIGESLSLPQTDAFPLVTALIPEDYANGNAQKIRDGMTAAAAENEFISTIDNNDLTIGSDGHHYKTSSMVRLGRNFGAAILSAQSYEDTFVSISYGEGCSGETRTLSGAAGNRAEVFVAVGEDKIFDVAFAKTDGTQVSQDVLSYGSTEQGFYFTLPEYNLKISIAAVEVETPELNPPDQEPLPEGKPSGGGLSAWEIAAIAIGAVIVVACAAVIVWKVIKRKKSK